MINLLLFLASLIGISLYIIDLKQMGTSDYLSDKKSKNHKSSREIFENELEFYENKLWKNSQYGTKKK